LGPVRSLVLAAPLEPAKHAEQLRRRQCRNGTRSDVRKQKILEDPHRLLQCLRRERLLREPLARDRLERIGAVDALGAPLGGRLPPKPYPPVVRVPAIVPTVTLVPTVFRPTALDRYGPPIVA